MLLPQLLLAVSAGSPPAREGVMVSPPTISSASPSQLPTTGATTLLVRGAGFVTGRAASCRLASATPGSAWTHAGYAGKSDLRFPATVINGSHLECAAPAVLAPGPGILSVATNCTTVPCELGNWDQHAPWQPGKPWAEPVRVTYFTLVDATVGRRPYINESTAELLIATHVSLRGVPLAVSAFLPPAAVNVEEHDSTRGSSWSWSIRPQNGSDIVSFPLKGLPATINTDLRITITGPAGVNFTRWRRFQRAPPLRADSRAVPVVVDHHTRSLNVGGKLFIGLGWYLGLADWNGTAHTGILPEEILELVRTQAALGVNQIQVIESQVRRWSNTQLLGFMDGCHEQGVKVIHPMMSFGTGGGGPNAQHYERHWDGSAEAAEWEAQVLANVTLIKDHPALLGYNICDDCCGASTDFIALQSRLYNTIKAADPHHITAGAVQCHNVWMWSDVENRLLLPQQLPLGRANDSQTQLSLDYPLIENYGMILSEPAGGAAPGDAIPGWVNPLLAQCTPASIDHSCTNTGLLVDHAGTGEWEGGTTGDGAFRHGAEWEPLCNIYSILADGAFQDIPAAPIDSRTGMWLGVITAGLVSQIPFELEFATLQPLSGPTGGWRQTIQLPLFGGELQALAPSLLAPFGSVPSLTVTVLKGVSLRPHGVIRGPVVRAAAWIEPGCSPNICAHLAVASFDQDSPAQFSVRIEGGLPGQQGKAAAMNATRLFDASYNVTLEADGTLSDWIGAGATHIYEIGCTGPRPAVQMRTGADPQGLPWAACANRRVQCANGFVHRDGGEPASPHKAACGVFDGHKNHTNGTNDKVVD